MQENDITYMDDDTFLKVAKPKLEALEVIRLEKLKEFQRRKKIGVRTTVAIITMIVISLLIGVFLNVLKLGNGDLFILTALYATLFPLMLALPLWVWALKAKLAYHVPYKTKVLPEIASLFGNFTYEMMGRIPMDVMRPSKIIPRHNRYNSQDLFSGTYNDVGIKFAKVKLSRKNSKSKTTVFKGFAILLTHGTRKFYGQTILTKDQDKLGQWFKKQTTHLKRANMVDPEFEGIFDVYTDDQTEARYLIDPLIIESLKALQQEYNGDKLLASFYNEQVLILIESQKNHFEPVDINIPATNEVELLSIKREMAQILSIVDRLSLYDPKRR